MKYIELTAWGNGKKHLIPLNKIIDFNFDEKYTTLSLISGSYLNVIENQEQITEILTYVGAKIVSIDLIDQEKEEYSASYERMADLYANDDLPF